MRHARHDAAMVAAERELRPLVNMADQKYIVIVLDGPTIGADREASFSSNMDLADVALVCDAVAKQIKQRSN